MALAILTILAPGAFIGPKRKNGRHMLPFAAMEATVGIEPTVRVLQTLALPLGDVALSSQVKTVYPNTRGLTSLYLIEEPVKSHN